MTPAERQAQDRQRQERTEQIQRDYKEYHDRLVREREQQRQQTERNYPEWIQRDIDQEKREQQQREKMTPTERQAQDRQRQERTEQIRRDYKEYHDRLVREREQQRQQTQRYYPEWVQREILEEQRIAAQRQRELSQPQIRYTARRNIYVGPEYRSNGIRNAHFNYRDISRLGHQYDAYNFIGNSATFISSGVFKSMLGMRMSSLIRSEPIGSSDDRIAVGNRFNLHHYLDYFGWVNAPVEVVAVTDTSFTVRTLPGHPLQGTVVHEVIKDKDNNFWLHQRGTGVENESRSVQHLTYMVAPGMWANMADRVGYRIFGVQRLRY